MRRNFCQFNQELILQKNLLLSRGSLVLEIDKILDEALSNIIVDGVYTYLPLPIAEKISIGSADGHLEVLISNFGSKVAPDRVVEIAGLKKTTRTGRLGAQDAPEVHLVLTCLEEVGRNCFRIFIREFIERSIVKRGCTTEVINSCINDFQLFFSRKNFSENEEMGLFAELLVLRELLKKYEAAVVINAWSGPDKYKYDFAFHNFALEVKSTTANQPQITINGSEQFKAQKNLTLILLNISVGQESSSSKIVEEISSKIIDYDIRKKFQAKVLKVSGKSDVEFRSFLVRETRLYSIERSFPSVANLKDAADFQGRIVKISYTVRLDGIECRILKSMEQLTDEV